MITVPTVVQKLQNYKYLTVDMNSPFCSKALENGTWWNKHNLVFQKQDQAIFTVFSNSLGFTWPQQMVHRQGQTRRDPTCFCIDRLPDRQSTEELTSYGMLNVKTHQKRLEIQNISLQSKYCKPYEMPIRLNKMKPQKTKQVLLHKTK